MQEEATITSKGQVTIPMEVRKRFGLKEGERIVFTERNGELLVKPKIKNAIKELQNLRKTLPKLSREEIDEMIKESKRAWSKFE